MGPVSQGSGLDDAGDSGRKMGALLCLSWLGRFGGVTPRSGCEEAGSEGNGGQVKKILSCFCGDPRGLQLGFHNAGADGGTVRGGCQAAWGAEDPSWLARGSDFVEMFLHWGTVVGAGKSAGL